MSKWESEMFQLESKEQLRAHRIHLWIGLLAKNGLDIRCYPWWTTEEKELERTLWAKADANYEARKAALKQQLATLSINDLSIYFKEIRVKEQSIDDWL